MNIYLIKNKLAKKILVVFNNLRLKRYYNEKLGKGKIYIAIILDKLLFRLIVLIAFVLFFYFISESFSFSIVISLQFFALYVLIMHKINKDRFKKRTALVNQQVVLKKTFKELLNQAPDDFLDYIVDILNKYGFNKVIKVDGRDLDMIGSIADRKIGIKCLQYDKDYKVGSDLVRDFFVGLRKNQLNEGVIITTSTFTQEANNLLVKLKKYAFIQLVDIVGLLEIMKKANLYPSDIEIRKIVLNEISDSRMNFKNYKEVVLSKGKIVKYILLGIVMILFGRYTPYTTYYYVIAAIIFIMAIVSLILLLIDLFQVNEEKHENKVL
ncbi:MAG: restriction endonuclease [Tissierellales bacterium]